MRNFLGRGQEATWQLGGVDGGKGTCVQMGQLEQVDDLVPHRPPEQAASLDGWLLIRVVHHSRFP